MLPIGSYRDLDDDDAFVWFRGFPRFENRAASLEAFYLHSGAWLSNRDAANDTLIDSDNVLLLRPAREHTGFDLRGVVRPSPSSDEEPRTFLWIGAMMLELPATDATVTAFERDALPRLPGASYFVTEGRRNEFPRLPVREDEYAFVVCARCDTLEDIEHCKQVVNERFIPAIVEPIVTVEHTRLRPTRRSLMR